MPTDRGKRRAPPPPKRGASFGPVSAPVQVPRPDHVVQINPRPNSIKAKAPPPPKSKNPVIVKISETTTTDITDTETETEMEDSIIEEPTVRQISQLSFQSEPDISATLDSTEIPVDIGANLARIVKSHSGSFQ